MSVLIITSTVNVNSCLTVLVDAGVRLKQYVDSVLFYLQSKKIDKIIICDNSLFDYSEIKVINDQALLNGKKIEFLNFEGDIKKIQEFGKGYGEGEIVQYVFKNSKLIREDEDCFLKVTGRLKLSNVDSILNYFKPKCNYFQPAILNPFTKSFKVDTRFYQLSKETFISFFMDSYKLVNDKDSFFLEHVYFRKLKEEKVKYKPFNQLPFFVGISGSTGISYEFSKLSFIKKTIFFKMFRFIY
ncbi:hypothetical protein [Flavobacterium magnesitis]|uniref:hypothetical protein n=1 Tax=Flavobacterium magnesitis TaxID=3138077 RepID=UPI00358EE122